VAIYDHFSLATDTKPGISEVASVDRKCGIVRGKIRSTNLCCSWPPHSAY